MKTIYKYDLQMQDNQTVLLPAGAEILSVKQQWDSAPATASIQMWALVDPSHLPVPRRFHIVGTGSLVPEIPILEGHLTFIATVVTQQGQLVWHVFEEFRYGNY